MQIILVSDQLSTAKSFFLSGKRLVIVVASVLFAVLLLSGILTYGVLRWAPAISGAPSASEVPLDSANAVSGTEQFGDGKGVTALAVRLGHLQAQLLRLDSVSQRISEASGIKPEELTKTSTSGKKDKEPEITAEADINDITDKTGKIAVGGPSLSSQNQISEEDLAIELDRLAEEISLRDSTLATLENLLIEERIDESMLPTGMPIAGAGNASGYGWRLDPFTRTKAFHEGVDFTAPSGTSIKAAAAGVVTKAEYVGAYGNMVELDHGNGQSTRYAHASKLTVKAGDIVQRGEVIAKVGSTGRSTGSHLHFEVRVNGIAQNPKRFLTKAGEEAKLAKK